MGIEKNILDGLLLTIHHISDADFQKKAWVDHKVHSYAFFEETIHQLFDDYEFSDVLSNPQVYGISSQQHVALRKLHDALHPYTYEKMSWIEAVDPKEVLRDPKWHEIQKLANEALIAFGYSIN